MHARDASLILVIDMAGPEFDCIGLEQRAEGRLRRGELGVAKVVAGERARAGVGALFP